jgi:phosphate-selective porin OprO/OprP
LQYNWRYGVFNQRNIQDEGNYISDHLQPEFAGRFANTWWYDEASDGRGYAHWAIAGTAAHPDGSTAADGPSRSINEARFQSRPEARTRRRWIDTGVSQGADWYELLAFEGVLNFGPVQWVGEYQNVWLQRDAGAGEDLHFDGGYMYVSYFLTGEHMPWDRESGTLDRIKPFENFWLVDTCDDGVRGGWGAWQVACRWSYCNFNDEDIFGGIGESVTAGLNWYWNANARMQFNYIYGDIQNRRPADGQTSGNYQILGTRFCIDF